jgi:hypothetical protein
MYLLNTTKTMSIGTSVITEPTKLVFRTSC